MIGYLFESKPQMCITLKVYWLV